MTYLEEEKKLVRAALVEALNFDEMTGRLTWRTWNGGGRKGPGQEAGFQTKRGYRSIHFKRFAFLSHRIAWLWWFNEWPEGEIDHINGKRSDNRIANLRLVDRTMNAENQRRPMGSNKSCGVLGVTFTPHESKGRPFKAQIKVAGKSRYLGNFACAEAAHAAYVEAKRELHKGNTL